MTTTTASEIKIREETTSITEYTLNFSGEPVEPRGSSKLQEMVMTESRDSETTQRTGSEPLESLMDALLKSTKTEDFADVVNSAWNPSETPSIPGTFPNLPQGELLLNAIPLSQKLLACMAARSINSQTAYACADLLGILGLDKESAILLRPTTVLESIIRLFTSDKEETRGGALRCMTTLITGSKEYCQCFVKNNIIRSIFDSIQHEKSPTVAAYACRTAMSLAHFLGESEEQLEALLSDIIPGLLSMLSEETELAAKLSSLQCLEDIQSLPSVSEKIKQDVFVQKLGSLLSSDDKQIEALAITLFGSYISDSNSAELKQLSPVVSYRVLSNPVVKEDPQFEQLRLSLLDSLLAAVHDNTFQIGDNEVQFLTQILLGTSQVCASRTVDILVVAWNIEMASSLAKIEGFLSQLPQVMTVTQGALRLIHSMLHARPETCQEMVIVMSASEIQSFRNQLATGDFEVEVLVFEIFYKMIEAGRLSDFIGVGVVEDIIERLDSASKDVKQRCWSLCKRLLEEHDSAASEECIRYGVVNKCGKVFEQLQDPGEFHTIQWEDLGDLFHILKLVSSTKSGSKSICEVGFLSFLFRCLESENGNHPGVFEILNKLLEATPVSSSRLFIENGTLKILAEAIQSTDLKIKRESFQLLKMMSFKESMFYLEDSNLVPILCSLLQNSNPKLTRDVVTVLCKISKSDMDNVCSQIVKSGLSSALWSASRSIPAKSDEYKTLWKVIQGIRSLEATQKASNRQKQVKVSSRRSSMTPSLSRRASTVSNLSRSASSIALKSQKKPGVSSTTTSRTTTPRETRCNGSSVNKESEMRRKTKNGKCQIPISKKKGRNQVQE